MDDEFYMNLVQYLTSKSYPPSLSEAVKQKIRRNCTNLSLKNGLLYKKEGEIDVLVIKRHQVPNILKECHDGIGRHKGIHGTYSIIKQRYYWSNMFREIKDYVFSCGNCQSNSNFSIKTTRPLKPIDVVAKPWYLCGMDMIGPLLCSPNGFQYILTMTDYFTKLVATRPLKTKNAIEVSAAIFSIYCNYGAPVRIITDNDPTFTSKINKELHLKCDTSLSFSAPYHPQTNGLDESTNKSVQQSLKKSLMNHMEHWPEYLESVTFSINNRVRDATKYSAFELMFGRKARLPIEAESRGKADRIDELLSSSGVEWNSDVDTFMANSKNVIENIYCEAKENIETSQKKMKKSYDKKLKPIKRNIKPGNPVLVVNEGRLKKHPGTKTQSKWSGPFTVKRVQDSIVEIETPRKSKRVRIEKVKPYVTRPKVEMSQEIDETTEEILEQFLRQGFSNAKENALLIREENIDSLSEIQFTEHAKDSSLDDNLVSYNQETSGAVPSDHEDFEYEIAEIFETNSDAEQCESPAIELLDPQEIQKEFESDAPDISLNILSRKIASIKETRNEMVVRLYKYYVKTTKIEISTLVLFNL